MSITLVEKKDSKSVLQRIQGGLSKYFVTARSYTSEETNEYLGITAVADDKSNISYVICARYAKDSTQKNPIIEIELNKANENIRWQVYIKTINPKHATMLEMFALCSYADDEGIYRGDTCSFQMLKSYVHNAAMRGMCKPVSRQPDFCDVRMDWDDVLNGVKDIYLEDAAYDQYQECLKLMEMFDYFYERLDYMLLVAPFR